MDLHIAMILETIQQLGRDEKVLRGMLCTSDIDHARVNETFVARVHALIDFVDDAEGCARQGLQGHEVEDGGDGAFAARLSMGVEDFEGFVFSGDERGGC